MADDQVTQLQQHTRQVQGDAGPSWSYFEYVLGADSAVNTMLATALRYFCPYRKRVHICQVPGDLLVTSHGCILGAQPSLADALAEYSASSH